ncbi:MAG: hypothetical protein ACJ73J_11470 [Actinomycetes bacterium]
MANLPSLKSLAELPDVPSPVLALVGAGDAAANAARDLPSKIAAIDPKSLDPRGREVDLSKLNPRNIDLTKLDPRAIDTAAWTATGLQWAAKSQETYEQLVARGELVISKARADEWADVTDATDATTVAEPPAAKPATKKAAPKAADKAATESAATNKTNTTKASGSDV